MPYSGQTLVNQSYVYNQLPMQQPAMTSLQRSFHDQSQIHQHPISIPYPQFQQLNGYTVHPNMPFAPPSSANQNVNYFPTSTIQTAIIPSSQTLNNHYQNQY
jgi:hypothetical protein